jgi:FkbM family methyltransferase
MLPSSIRKLSHNPVIRGVAGKLHLTGFARDLYTRLLTGNGVLQASCLGATASFKADNSKQLAFVDYILTTEMDFIEAALEDLKPGEAFLDVGCHYGIFSIFAAKLLGPQGQVFSVEPHPGNLKILQGNIDLNRCSNVKVVQAALSEVDGTIQLSYNENGAGPKGPNDPDSSVHEVKALPGDALFSDNTRIPAAIKIDVEGHEFAVLKGLTTTLSNKQCRRLCVEVHPDLLPGGITKDAIVAFIKKCGLRIAKENPRDTVIHVIAVRDSVAGMTSLEDSGRQ